MSPVCRYLFRLSLLLVVAAYSSHGWTSVATADISKSATVEQMNLEQLLLQGQRLLDEGRLKAAMDVFDQVLIRAPNHSSAIYQKGVVLVRGNDYRGGITLIEQAVSLDPDNLIYREALASMYEFSGRLEDAQRMNQEIMAVVDSDSDEFNVAKRNVGFITATILARQGEIRQAEQSFSELADRYPDDFMVRYSLGVALMIQGKLEAAEESLSKANRLNPLDANTYLSLAAVYERQGQLSQAYDMLLKIVALDVASALQNRARTRMYIIEGRLLMAEGNAATALDVFIQAQELDPVNAEVLFNLGVVYEQLDDWLGVIDVSERLLQLNPARADVILRLAQAYAGSEQYILAAAEFQRLIDLLPGASQAVTARLQLQRLLASPVGRAIVSSQRENQIVELKARLSATPDDVDLLQPLVTLLLQQQRWAEARLLLEQLLVMEPADGLTHTSLALVYEKLGLYAEAIQPYAYGVSLEPNPDIAARIALTLTMMVAKTHYVRGVLGEAELFFAEILARQPNNSEALFYTGLIYSRQDRVVKAIDAFQRVLQYAPSHINARLNLAMSYHRLKREEEAIEEFRNALQFNPTARLAERIKKQMAGVEKSIRGISGGLSYVLSYDNNSNLNSDKPLAEYRTDLAPYLVYRYKAGNGLRWRLSSSPVYSSYHNGQYDFLNTNTSLSASISKGRVTVVGGGSYQVARGLLNSQRASNSKTYYAEWIGRFKLPLMLQPWRPQRVLTNTTLRVSYNEFESVGSSFFSAFRYAAVASVNQPIAVRTVLSLNYRATLSENMEVVGSDYASRGQGIDIRLERGVAAGISVNGSYSLRQENYLNPDSASGFSVHRANRLQVFTAGVGYQFHPSLRFFATINWTVNGSNLPTGFIINAQDVVEGLQSPSLGDYNRTTFTAGVALSL